jgi:phosphoribosyl 1,2-cyclic phosphodiesterase
VKLEFLGTRGYTEAETPRHRRHSSIKVSYRGRSVVVDCGEDWLGEVRSWDAQAIVVTHAHPDHAWGLKDGAPCPVHATEPSWEGMEGFAIRDRRMILPRDPTEIEGIVFEAFPVDHSSRAPAVGYRVSAGAVTIFYVPDVVWIRDREAALSGTKMYIGDGATVARSLVRKIDDQLIGHAPIRTQLTWCQQEAVPRAVFTHLGSQIVSGDERASGARIRELAAARGVEALIAHDGMQIVLR